MAVITIQQLHKSFGAEVIFDGLDLVLHRKEKVGLVGANGSGKTTFFKLIAGLEQVDVGQVIRKKDLEIGYLPQEPIFEGDKTVLEEVHSQCELILKLEQKIEKLSEQMSRTVGAELKAVMREYDRLCHEFEIAGGYEYESRVKTILAGVGIDESLYGVKTNELSGGQKSRLGLAKVLLGRAELLLLDEPTNHLDLSGRQWLEKFIMNYDGAAVIVSHDRYLLDRVASKIIEVKNKSAKTWKGNYTRFVEESAKQKLAANREHEKRVEFVKNELDFIARNKDQEGMRGTARGRKKRLERLLAEEPDYLEKNIEDRNVDFGFENLQKKSDIVLRCEDASKRYGDLVLFENLSFEMFSGQRLGITGPNNTGKTSLIKMAIGQVEPTSGTIRLGKTLKAGYLDQQGAELDSNLTVLE